MDVESVIKLFRRPPTIEILTEERLRESLESGVKLRHYIGFEVSGFLHLGTGVVPLHKIVDLQHAGVETRIFLADYHSWINRKLGGDLDVIRKVAVSYYKDTFSHVLDALGGDSGKTKFILASELYNELGNKYFENILKVSMSITLARAKRSVSILGRRSGESLSLAQLLYVPMQVSDIFAMKVNVAHGGIDQRKAHVIAIDLGNVMGYKPIALHHGMLLGIGLSAKDVEILRKARFSKNRDDYINAIVNIKMSKSLPQTAIFLHDNPETIKKEALKAYCPPKEVDFNPVVSLMEYVIYPYLMRLNKPIKIVNPKRNEEFEFKNITELKNSYRNGDIHPLDLKNAVYEYLIKILKPVINFLNKEYGRKYIEEMGELMITR